MTSKTTALSEGILLISAALSAPLSALILKFRTLSRQFTAFRPALSTALSTALSALSPALHICPVYIYGTICSGALDAPDADRVPIVTFVPFVPNLAVPRGIAVIRSILESTGGTMKDFIPKAVRDLLKNRWQQGAEPDPEPGWLICRWFVGSTDRRTPTAGRQSMRES